MPYLIFHHQGISKPAVNEETTEPAPGNVSLTNLAFLLFASFAISLFYKSSNVPPTS